MLCPQFLKLTIRRVRINYTQRSRCYIKPSFDVIAILEKLHVSICEEPPKEKSDAALADRKSTLLKFLILSYK